MWRMLPAVTLSVSDALSNAQEDFHKKRQKPRSAISNILQLKFKFLLRFRDDARFASRCVQEMHSPRRIQQEQVAERRDAKHRKGLIPYQPSPLRQKLLGCDAFY